MDTNSCVLNYVLPPKRNLEGINRLRNPNCYELIIKACTDRFKIFYSVLCVIALVILDILYYYHYIKSSVSFSLKFSFGLFVLCFKMYVRTLM